MGSSILGLHFQGAVPGWASNFYAVSGSSTAKYLGGYADFSNVENIGRIVVAENTEPEPLNSYIAMGEPGADIVFTAIWPEVQKHPEMDAWIPYNESSFWEERVANGFVAFNQRLIKRFHDAGKKIIVGAINTGHPKKESEDGGKQIKLILDAAEGADGISFHAYHPRDMRESPDSYCCRYRHVHNYAVKNNREHPPFYILECGIDDPSSGPDHGHAGWQEVLKNFPDKEQEYVDQLLWYEQELRKDASYVKGATIFIISPFDWGTFNFYEGVAMKLANELALLSPTDPPPESEPGPWINDIRAELPKHPTKTWVTRERESVDCLVVHHSAAEPPEGTTIREHLKAIARYHIEHNDWPGIGYHAAIGAKGVVWILNNSTDITYHSGNADMNARSFGVCLLGDLTTHNPTQEQLNSLRWLRRTLELPAIGHKEVVQTACPGPWWTTWKDWVNDGEVPPVPPPATGFKIVGPNGEDWTWEQFTAKFGPIKISDIEGEGWYIKTLTVRDEPTTNTCIVRAPANTKIAWYWPDAPVNSACTPPNGLFPEMVQNRVETGVCNASGDAGFSMGTGAYYWPNQGQIGPHAAWVCGQNSQIILGAGMIAATNHAHFDIEFEQRSGPTPPPINVQEAIKLIHEAQDLMIQANICNAQANKKLCDAIDLLEG